MAGIPIVERSWAWLLETLPPFHLKTTLTFVIHELSYWLAYLPFLLCDAVPALRRYKLQPDKPAAPAALARCLLRVLVTHTCLVLPMIFVTHPVLDLMKAPHSVETLPRLEIVLLQVVLFFLLEDLCFYFGHRALHTPTLYRAVHAIHHEHAAPFGMAAEYAHPLEVIFLGTCTILPPLLVGPHLFTLLVYLCLRCLQTVECHSGYDLPCSPNKWLPMYGGARFHDHHHRIHSGNYSSTFTWVDALFGTDTAYQAWERAQTKRAALKDESEETLATTGNKQA
jgi:plant 4alpha-monomethylsterol monooxygenase